MKEVNLLEHLPLILRSILDFKVLAETEQPEYIQLHSIIDQIINNNFIATADLQGIKRWEQLLNITPDSIDLEERRAAVLGRWNRSLPYTLHRLKECLDVLVGRNGYQINLQPQAYFFELFAEDQPLSMLHTMRSLVKEMLPANLVFKVCNNIKLNTDISLTYSITQDFYTEYPIFPTIIRNYMDGSVQMNGKYRLDAYREPSQTELYHSEMNLFTNISQKINIETELEYEDTFCMLSGLESNADFQTPILPKIEFQTEQEIASTYPIKYAIEDRLIIEKYRNQMNGKRKMNGEILMNSEVVYTYLDQ